MSKVNIQGLDRLKIKLAFMTDPDGVSAGVKAAAVHLKDKAAIYPPKPAESTYDRTGKLGERWAVNLKRLGATVSNNTSYGPLVQGDDQVWYHEATGWKTTETIAEEETEEVLNLIKKAIDRVLNK